MLTVSLQDLYSRRACNFDSRRDALDVLLGRSAGWSEQFPLTTWAKLGSTSALDLVWALRVARPYDAAHKAAMEIALSAYYRCPSVKKPVVYEDLVGWENERTAVDAVVTAANNWLANPTRENERAAAAAAHKLRRCGRTHQGRVAELAAQTAIMPDMAWKAASVAHIAIEGECSSVPHHQRAYFQVRDILSYCSRRA